jgi:hypothetical protein
MPNGRSGGFLLDVADLKRVIMASPSGEVIAFVSDDQRRFTALTEFELTPLVDQCLYTPVAVEEQDGSVYVIHLGDELTRWVVVGSESPLQAPLRQLHSQWSAQHPERKEWIAF